MGTNTLIPPRPRSVPTFFSTRRTSRAAARLWPCRWNLREQPPSRSPTAAGDNMSRPFVLLLALVPTLARASEPDAVFDVAALTAQPLNPRTLSTAEKDGIITEEIVFHAGQDGLK